MTITLIGMPGSGKSFVGRQLAAHLGIPCIEMDPILVTKYGKPLQEVVEMLTPEVFLDEEAAETIAATSNIQQGVISPGGSIIYRDTAMQHLSKVSTIIYLEVSRETLEARIGSAPRGIVNAPGKTFADLYAERTPRYERWAAHTINGEAEPEQVIRDILKVV
jgi:shikimate kinase